MSDLLNCPFCGGIATTWEDGDNSPNWGVQCDNWRCCGLSGFRTEAEAVAAWNTRTPPAATYQPAPDGEYALPDGDIFEVYAGGRKFKEHSHGATFHPRHSLPDALTLCECVAPWSAQEGQGEDE